MKLLSEYFESFCGSKAQKGKVCPNIATVCLSFDLQATRREDGLSANYFLPIHLRVPLQSAKCDFDSPRWLVYEISLALAFESKRLFVAGNQRAKAISPAEKGEGKNCILPNEQAEAAVKFHKPPLSPP